MSRFISLDEAVSGAQLALGHTSDQHRNLFREWANDANRSIGVIHNLNLKDAKNIKIKDMAFDIPCDYLEPLEIVLKGSNSINNQGVVFPLLVVNNTLSQVGAASGVGQRSVNITEQKDQFVLSSNSEGISFNSADLKYYALPMDDDGFPLIPEYNKRAIESYVEYMFVKQQRHRMRGKGRDTQPPQSEVGQLYQQWLILKADAITNKNRLNVPEADEVVRKWMTLLPQPGPIKNNRKRRYIGGIVI